MKAYRKTSIKGVVQEIEIDPPPHVMPQGFTGGYMTALFHQSVLKGGRWYLNGAPLETALTKGILNNGQI